MSALVVQSRFAGLTIEDDDYPTSSDAQKAKKNKASNVKKPELPKKSKSNSKQQNGSQNKKKKIKPNNNANQWELWKQKDEELVDGSYECQLQQALLLSKLDFEEKKDVFKHLKKEAEIDKKAASSSRASSKKEKKKNVMSLDQFHNTVPAEEEEFIHSHSDIICQEKSSPEPDPEFFDRVQEEAKHELLKDNINNRVQHREAVSDDIITRIKYVEAMEEKDKEIAVLKQQVASLKDELFTVKTRNKKLYNILGQGEMKDKAEVLVEVERLRGVQTELTTELANLHSDLERERSKNTDARARDKRKKGGSGDKEK